MKDLTPVRISEVIIRSEMSRATLYNRFGKYPKAIELMQLGVLAEKILAPDVIESLIKQNKEEKC